ncbi:DNA-binding transcriptional regulator, PadR family [Saccharopolyspora antimicrobica]|uniref:DNA-binding PadR family transcriptional regulator n=1 Tax=Saccharopolyspora antimicrobica TaxID=455193 RepID=A0A1I4XDU5_9PSEU|nr:PadR family transcriptional regulator [Saccharopolyspora antimicrobica]RKT84441.1 DNA-binding PadR family transcriptional regulator [Saccharopolyspora antimicrobica]SFN23480.1 DNA-binding transcriptional regulator, PadR family [Saccharopolyspora antimicrobica]
MLELAVLGLLHEAPMHGYELRKRLHDAPGAFRALSCGTLYPTLRRLQRAGLIEEQPETPDARGWGRRARRVYRVTTAGEFRFAELVGDCGPQACDDNAFGVHVVFFSRTPAEARLRILEGRRRRVEERREGLRNALADDDRFDRYTRELHRLRLDHSEREIRWLDEIIEHERAEQAAAAREQELQGHDR